VETVSSDDKRRQKTAAGSGGRRRRQAVAATGGSGKASLGAWTGLLGRLKRLSVISNAVSKLVGTLLRVLGVVLLSVLEDRIGHAAMPLDDGGDACLIERVQPVVPTPGPHLRVHIHGQCLMLEVLAQLEGAPCLVQRHEVDRQLDELLLRRPR
jgi:hypothetical protein